MNNTLNIGDQDYHKDAPLVSIIIPTYRRSETLLRALKSAINQTYPCIEIIVVDDNAEYPNERKENEKLLKAYPQITLVKNVRNLGGGLSRNEGVEHSNGEFLAFLDDDDEFMPTKIEEQYSLYNNSSESSKIGMIYTYAEVMRVNRTKDSMRRDDVGAPLARHIQSCVAPGSALFIPRKVFNAVGGFEDISSRQDATLIMKIILKGYTIDRVQKELYRYYWHDGTNGITKTSQKSLDAEIQYRDLFFSKVSSMKMATRLRKNIAAIYACRLAVIMLNLGYYRKALKELPVIIKNSPFSIFSLMTIAKILMGPFYTNLSHRREKKRRLG